MNNEDLCRIVFFTKFVDELNLIAMSSKRALQIFRNIKNRDQFSHEDR